MPSPMLYTIEQASELLAIGRTRLFEFIRKGEIETVQIGRSRRIPHSALEAFVDSLRNQ